MSESYYNQAPLKDARYARKVTKDGNDEVSQYLKAFRLATDKNVRELYIKANEQRESLVNLGERLAIEVDVVPADCQGLLAKVMTRITETLASCQIFPPPFTNSPLSITKTLAKTPGGAKAKTPSVSDDNVAKIDSNLGVEDFSSEASGDTGSIFTASNESPIQEGMKEIGAKNVESQSKEAGAKSAAVVDERPNVDVRPKTADDSKKKSEEEIQHRSISETGADGYTRVRGKKKKSSLLDFVPEKMRTDLDLQEESSIPVVTRVVTEDELRNRRLAAFQRDNFIQKKNEYVEKILEKGRLIEEKLNQGGNF